MGRRGAVVVAVAALLIGGVGPASAAAPPEPLELLPGVTDVVDVTVTDSQVVAVAAQEFGMPLLYSRTISSTEGGSSVGATTFVARASGFGFAVDDAGTLAFSRAADGRLMLHDTDGTVTTPSWGADPSLVTWGVASSGGLSASWVANARGTIFDRSSGTSYDLLAEVVGEAAAASGDYVPTDVSVDEAGALLSIYDFVGSGFGGAWWVPLTDQPGTPVRLAQEGYPIGVVGGRIVWVSFSPSYDEAFLNTVAVGSPSGTPETLSLGGSFPDVLDAGDAVVVADYLDDSTDLTWRDPATLTELSTGQIVTPYPWVQAVHGSFAAYSSWPDGTSLMDLGGDSLTGDQTPVSLPITFADARESAFYGQILWMADQGITTGYADGTFRPKATISREAMAAFLYRMAGSPSYSPPAVSPFTDVAPSATFYKQICWLADEGITTGYPDGTFRRTAPVSREAMAAFLYRFAGSPSFTPPGTSPFSDVATSSKFYQQITWMASTGITTGYADSTFRPVSSITRAAMAAFLFRFDDAGLG